MAAHDRPSSLGQEVLKQSPCLAAGSRCDCLVSSRASLHFGPPRSTLPKSIELPPMGEGYASRPQSVPPEVQSLLFSGLAPSPADNSSRRMSLGDRLLGKGGE